MVRREDIPWEELQRLNAQGWSYRRLAEKYGVSSSAIGRRAVLEGDVERGSLMAGQVAGMLHEIRPVRDIFQEIYTGAQGVLRNVSDAWNPEGSKA